MNESHSTRSIWLFPSAGCFVIGVFVWIPFSEVLRLWSLTFIINPLGVVFGYIGKSKFGMVANGLMTLNFFIFMFFGYMINAIFGGTP